MSGLDPFGSKHGFKPRSSNGGMPKGNVVGSIGNMAREVSDKLGSHKSVGWARVGAYLGVTNAGYGVLVALWALTSLSGHSAQYLGLVLGCSLVAMGASGMLAIRKDASSMKTLYLTAAALVGLLAWSFVMQVGDAARNDCVLAETFLRIDHLEEALSKLKHDEMLSGVMMRLDHMESEITHMEDHATDKVNEAREQEAFKDQDQQYVSDKLHVVMDIADRMFEALETQIDDVNRNLTSVQNVQDGQATNEESLSEQQLKARLRSLRYRQRSLEPKRKVIQDLMSKLSEHQASGEISTDEYSELLRVLSTAGHFLGKDVRDEIQDEKADLEYVKASVERLDRNEYSSMDVGDYKDKAKMRQDRRKRQKERYSTFMDNAMKKHENLLSSKEKYLNSLDKYLDSMPEHCMDDLEEMQPGQIVGWIAMALASVSTYTALTATVMSVKKDY